MHISFSGQSLFRPVALLVGLAVAALLFASWAYIDATRIWWDAADKAVFFTLNGLLAAGGTTWHSVWAVANSRAFDFAIALVLLVLLYRFQLEEGRARFAERFSMCVFMALAIVATSVIADFLVQTKRPSASLALVPVYYLNDLVPWVEAKDRSYNSFPSDHGTIALMLVGLLWKLGGKRYGITMLAIATIAVLPRLVGGAHWLTDVLVGALTFSIVSCSVLLFTPIHGWIIAVLNRLMHKPFFHASLKVVHNRETPALIGKGICMGGADIIPGVSGGTIAYIMGIWYRLIEAIRSFDVEWFRLVLRGRITLAVDNPHIRFLLPLLAGILTAVVVFTTFIPVPKLLITYPEAVYGLFFGLIGGSILLLLIEMEKLRLKDMLWLAVGTALGWLLVNIVPVETPDAAWFIFLCGCFAISAMLLPGVSGSFVLLVLGKYAYILDGVGRFDLTIILPFLGGCIVGVLAFSRVASWLLHHYYRISVLTIIGILIGSLWMIWPFQQRHYEWVRDKERLVSSHPILPVEWNGMVMLALLLMVAGVAAVMMLHYVAERKRAREGMALLQAGR